MKPRTAMGLLMMFSSLAFFAGGGFIIQSTVDMQEREARQKAETDRQCVQQVNTLANVTVTQTGGDLVAIVRDVTDPRRAMTDATVAAMMCPGKVLTDTCIGDGCEGAQGKVILRFKLAGAVE